VPSYSTFVARRRMSVVPAKKKNIHDSVYNFFGRNALWLCSLLLSITCYYFYARDGERPAWVNDLLLHLATAFFIAFFLDMFFEYNFHVRYLERWGRDVLQAVAGTLISPSIVTEVSSILKSPLVRAECVYKLEFEAPPDGDSSLFILRRSLSYKACNKIGRRIPLKITSSVENKRQSPYTKHLLLHVGGREVTNFQTVTSGGYLKLSYDHSRGLAPAAEIAVFTVCQEVVELAVKQNSYIVMVPCESLEIHPVNSYPKRIGKITIRMHHSINEEIVPDALGNFQFPYAVLPGQGFDIVWEVL
jgi:hypothetical protein